MILLIHLLLPGEVNAEPFFSAEIKWSKSFRQDHILGAGSLLCFRSLATILSDNDVEI